MNNRKPHIYSVNYLIRKFIKELNNTFNTDYSIYCFDINKLDEIAEKHGFKYLDGNFYYKFA